MSQDPPSPDCLVAEVLDFARDKLGPASERLMARPASQALVLSRRRAGDRLEDAVLRIVHRYAREDRAVANEFVAFFLGDLLKLGRPMISTGLRRFLDTGDLIQSVLGDLWGGLSTVRFETRAGYLSLLVQRLGWKASDKVRGLRRERRREDLRVSRPPEDLEIQACADSPLSAAARDEERGRLVRAMLRLSERDRLLLRHHFRGDSLGEIAAAVNLSSQSARKALYRAIRRARELLQPSETRASTSGPEHQE